MKFAHVAGWTGNKEDYPIGTIFYDEKHHFKKVFRLVDNSRTPWEWELLGEAEDEFDVWVLATRSNNGQNNGQSVQSGD